MTIKRTKAGHPAARAKRRLRTAAPKVGRVRSSDAGDITAKPMLIGYARVSTVEQNLALQRDALTEAGCAKIFTEQMSGAVTERPALHDALEFARSGDTLIVWKLDGSVANPAAVRRDEVRAGGSSRVGLQGTPLRGRDRALGGALVLSLRGELPRPRADDGRTRRLGRPLDDFPMGPEVRSGDREAPTLAVAPATLDELAHRRDIREGPGQVAYLYRAVDKFGNMIDFYLSPTRNTKAAKRFLSKTLNGLKDWDKPRVINTDKAPS